MSFDQKKFAWNCLLGSLIPVLLHAILMLPINIYRGTSAEMLLSVPEFTANLYSICFCIDVQYT